MKTPTSCSPNPPLHRATTQPALAARESSNACASELWHRMGGKNLVSLFAANASCYKKYSFFSRITELVRGHLGRRHGFGARHRFGDCLTVVMPRAFNVSQ
ncbi:hypothetical protein IPV27_08630 [Acidovorax sp. SD340]|nr:hypothetical protein [Acidovorax sp. SD340]